MGEQFAGDDFGEGQTAFVKTTVAEAAGIAREHQLFAARHARRPFRLERAHARRIVLDLVEEIVAVPFAPDEVNLDPALSGP